MLQSDVCTPCCILLPHSPLATPLVALFLVATTAAADTAAAAAFLPKDTMPVCLSERERVQIESFSEAGWTITRIGQRIDRPRDTVYRFLCRIKDGPYEPSKPPGRRRLLSADDVTHIVAEVLSNPFLSITFIAEREKVSRSVMSKTLREQGLFSCMATIVNPLDAISIAKRYMWSIWMKGLGDRQGAQYVPQPCWPATPSDDGYYDTRAIGVLPALPGMPYHGLTWLNVVFTDETAIRLGEGRHARVLHPLGEGLDPKYYQDRSMRASCLHLWGGIAYGVKLPLVALCLKQQRVSAARSTDADVCSSRCHLASSILV